MSRPNDWRTRYTANDSDEDGGESDGESLPDVDLTAGKRGKDAALAILNALAKPAGNALHQLLAMPRPPRNAQSKAQSAMFVLAKLLDADADVSDQQAPRLVAVDIKEASRVLLERRAAAEKAGK
jgi:hypothetical protein